jgi:hypothetical protein
VRLVAARETDGPGIHRRRGALIAELAARPVRPDIAAGTVGSAAANCGLRRMRVLRHLICRQRDRFRAAHLADHEAASHMHRHATLQIRQRKRILSVAAVSRADEVEECVVFSNGNQLAVAKRPVLRREIARKQPDLADVRL